MIKVTIELYPYGYEDGKENIGEVIIGNDATSKDFKIGNYNIWVNGVDNHGNKKETLMGRVENFQRDLGIHHLLLRGLQSALKEID